VESKLLSPAEVINLISEEGYSVKLA
jgi:hypothetical protein